MAEPKFTAIETAAGKARVAMFWYFNGEKIRKTFKSQKEGEKWCRGHRRKAGTVERSLLDADGPEQADIVTALDMAREHGFTLTEAARAFIDAKPVEVADLELEDVEREFLRHCHRENRRQTTINNYERALRMLRMKVLKLANEITRSDIDEFLDNREWDFATRNWYIRHCRPLFNWLLEQDRIAVSPFHGVKQKSVDEKPPCVLTVKQTAKLMAAAVAHDPGTIPYLALGLFAGIRPSGLERLTWKDIDLRQKVIHVTGSTNKTRDRFLCDMQPNLSKWLKLAKSNDIVPTNFRKRYEAVRLIAGTEWGPDIMRHTFAAHHVAAFGDAGKTAYQLGHKGDSAMLFDHYRNIVTPAEGRRFFKILPP